ncbi:SDR family NAD(P)-dependent oxidoreductase [Actinoplanes subglobosus]|uniref:SDR family NAD(P)-dependent oxidoreductase n=1 Tax=Actinoplanes subglobosus TaxID=1547892 RepID=A0ABV8IH98_9ACTN
MKLDSSVRWEPGASDLTGTNVAIIGGTGGLGRAFARSLAARGASVLVVGRTFRDADVPGIRFQQADLNLMREAERVAAELPAETLDVVVFTTGIMAATSRQQTDEGIERDTAVSYLSRYVILRSIAGRLRNGTRVFIMGMPGMGQTGSYDDLNAERSYKSMAVHSNTVAANEALVLDAAEHYPGLRVFGLNPGIVKTAIRGNMLGEGSWRQKVLEGLIGLFTPSADTYAARVVPLLTSPDLVRYTGVMFNRKAQAILPSPGLTQQHVDGFMTASAALAAKVS